MHRFVAILLPIVSCERFADGLLAEQTIFRKRFKIEMGHRDCLVDYAEKDVPQPQDLEAFGLLNLKPPPTMAVT